MEIHDGIKFLIDKYSSYDWYDSVALDKHKRYVVYVTTMNSDIMKTVQQSLDGKQVLISYALSKPENMRKYNKIINFSATFHSNNEITEIDDVDAYLDVEDDYISDINELSAELDRLEKICGSQQLQHIFYEIHDGKNAVTNLGSKYPEIKRDMIKLYNKYGFDIIYDEIDG